MLKTSKHEDKIKESLYLDKKIEELKKQTLL